MSTPQERIQSDLIEAMKAGEKERVGVLRMLLAEVKNERIKVGEEVDEKRFVAVVRRAVKQRAEAATQFRKGGRVESAEQEERESVILESYLPEQADEAEVRTAVEAYVAAEGLSGPASMGAVMKAMMAHFGDRADGGTISKIAREALG